MNTQIIRPPAFQRPSGKLYLANAQLDLINTVPTLVIFDAIGSGYKDGIENTVTHRITPGVAGFYSMKSIVLLSAVLIDKYFTTEIRISGVSRGQMTVQTCFNGLISIPTLTDFYFTAADFVELWVTSQNGNHEVDIVAGVESSFLSVQRVR